MKVLQRIWDYFRPSWEGSDDKFSYRRACQFVFVWLMVFMVINDRVQTSWSFYTFLTLAILFALIVSLITVEQLIVLAKNLAKLKPGGDFGFNNKTHEEDITDTDGPDGPVQ